MEKLNDNEEYEDPHEIYMKMVECAKKLPFGYRDVEYEERLLRNSIREEGRIEGKNIAIVEMCKAGVDKKLIAKAFNLSMKKLNEILKKEGSLL